MVCKTPVRGAMPVAVKFVLFWLSTYPSMDQIYRKDICHKNQWIIDQKILMHTALGVKKAVTLKDNFCSLSAAHTVPLPVPLMLPSLCGLH